MTYKSFKNALFALTVYLISITCVFGQTDEVHDNGLPSQLTTNLEDQDTCGNPNYLTLKGRLLENYDSSEEFYRLHSIANTNFLERYSRSNESFHIHGFSQECANLQVGVNIQGGMTCPGRYVLNRDNNRVPCVMREFRCLCGRCLTPHLLLSRRSGHTCKPIYHYVTVMRRTINMEDESDTWSYVLEPLAVGCRCTPPVHRYSTTF